MNLVKWFRKYNKKVMAIVVIIIMFSFVAGTYISHLTYSRWGGAPAVAKTGKGEKITGTDLNNARNELEVLRELNADRILRGLPVPGYKSPDLRAFLLSDLLFSERQGASQVLTGLKNVIRRNEYLISDEQLNSIMKDTAGAGRTMYWLLLSREAQQAGITVSDENSGKVLAQLIPQLFQGATYSQVIGSIVSRSGLEEKGIVATFGKLLGVMEYAKLACSVEPITNLEIMQDASRQIETMDVNMVRLDSSEFISGAAEPDSQQIDGQFGKYKDTSAGVISDENPYGYGYKFPQRASIEYMVVSLDEIKKTIAVPTQEETEEFYEKNPAFFTQQIPSDPNDPNSKPVEKRLSYPEVAAAISAQILQSRINGKAETILQEAKTLTEAGLEKLATGTAKLTNEQYQQAAGDYVSAAKALSEKHKIKVYTDKTGLLTAVEFMLRDRYLSRLYLAEGVQLGRIVFAIEELGTSDLGIFEIPKPRMFENIGPLRDGAQKTMAIVRVTAAEKEAAPKSIDEQVGRDKFEFEDTPADREFTNVKDIVAADLKKASVTETLETKANELIELAKKDGWDNALKQFNEKYGSAKAKAAGKDTFVMDKLKNMRRLSNQTVETFRTLYRGDPTSEYIISETQKDRQLIDKIHSLLPRDSNSTGIVPVVIKSDPYMSSYAIKDLSIRFIDQRQFEMTKGFVIYKTDTVMSQSMAAVHFDPHNILKRMNYEKVETEDQPAIPYQEPPIPLDD